MLLDKTHLEGIKSNNMVFGLQTRMEGSGATFDVTITHSPYI
jgi:hypothetical protein